MLALRTRLSGKRMVRTYEKFQVPSSKFKCQWRQKELVKKEKISYTYSFSLSMWIHSHVTISSLHTQLYILETKSNKIMGSSFFFFPIYYVFLVYKVKSNFLQLHFCHNRNSEHDKRIKIITKDSPPLREIPHN